MVAGLLAQLKQSIGDAVDRIDVCSAVKDEKFIYDARSRTLFCPEPVAREAISFWPDAELHQTSALSSNVSVL